MNVRHVILSERGVGRGSGVEAKDLSPAIMQTARPSQRTRSIPQFQVPSSI